VAGSTLTFHSIYGAIQESNKVFIESGLRHPAIVALEKVRVFEAGFGTGLNALLTLLETQKSDQHIRYETIEPFPLDLALVNALNYCDQLNAPDLKSLFYLLHTCPFEKEIRITDRFTFQKKQVDLASLACGTSSNLIYFDAFAPEDQPELWTEQVFRKLFNCCESGALLLTYSSKGQVRRNLQSAGFAVEKLQGPPGKKQITRAYKPF